MRGGIERYVKTFPKGGFWNGKNYLFDRRMEQVPGTKDQTQVEQEVNAKCSVCRRKWTAYRGKFKCSQSLCGVPVIVCPDCDTFGLKNPTKLNCELCKQGYRAPTGAGLDLAELKRNAESIVINKSKKRDADTGITTDASSQPTATKKAKKEGASSHTDRLFLARLPLTISKSKLIEALVGSDTSDDDKIKRVHWLADKNSGAFYGSCIVEVSSAAIAKEILDKANGGEIKLGKKKKKKKIRASFASVKEDEVWPPKDYGNKEFPPVGG